MKTEHMKTLWRGLFILSCLVSLHLSQAGDWVVYEGKKYNVNMVKYGESDWFFEDVYPCPTDDELYGEITAIAVGSKL